MRPCVSQHWLIARGLQPGIDIGAQDMGDGTTARLVNCPRCSTTLTRVALFGGETADERESAVRS
jgi:hypothetical protein